MQVAPENYMTRLWHTDCPQNSFRSGVMRYVRPEQTIEHDDGSPLYLAECLHCGEKGYIGLDKKRIIIVRTAT